MRIMATWSKAELDRIAATDDLHVAPFREDGKTYGTPTWIWSVVVEDALYARAYSGKDSRWYRAALRQKNPDGSRCRHDEGVTFEAVEGAINDRVDEAYRGKYEDSPYLGPMIGAGALRNGQDDTAAAERV
jgi:hypothetical protein